MAKEKNKKAETTSEKKIIKIIQGFDKELCVEKKKETSYDPIRKITNQQFRGNLRKYHAGDPKVNL